MPKRQNTRTVNSEKVQGDDSWIKVRALTVREAQILSDGWEAWSDAERVEHLAPIVAGWNWVDDDGNPLPQPGQQPGVILDLNAWEIRFIIDSLGGDVKN